MKRIILASASPRRREYLSLLGYPFTVRCPQVDERNVVEREPVALVEKLAHEKALSVAKTLWEGIVIGADTVVVLEGEIFGKPGDKADARGILLRMQGKKHRVYTGLSVIDAGGGVEKTGYMETDVTMAAMTEEEIASYVATGEPMDKAGAYAIQGRGSIYIERIEGCYFNVLGLPLRLLHTMIKDML